MSNTKKNTNTVYLPDGTWAVKLVQHEYGNEYFLEYEHSRICPFCGGNNCTVKGSSYTQTVRHVPLANHSVFLTFRKKRFFCRDCGISFFEHPAWLHENLHMTCQLYFDIYFKLTELIPLKTIAGLCCVPEPVVRDVMDSLSFDRPSYLPETLCIDEFKGDAGEYSRNRKKWHHDKYQCNIVNGDSGACIDVLPDYHSDYLKAYFRQFDKSIRDNVRYICCDMHNGYVTLARSCFPDAIVCIDMFHVIKDLNSAVDRVRIRLQKSSTSLSDAHTLFNLSRALKTKSTNQDRYWTAKKKNKLDMLDYAFSQYPELSVAYEALQNFHVINDSSDDIHIRRACLSDWINTYISCGVSEVETVAGSIRYWRKGIENSWLYNKSNASCEGVNKRIKDIKRMSGGMQNFENFRKRILLICGDMHLAHSAYEYALPNRHI